MTETQPLLTAPSSASAGTRLLYRCAVAAPLLSLLDYLPPKAGSKNAPNQPLPLGTRVTVPLGNRLVNAVVVEVIDSSSPQQNLTNPEKLRAIDSVIDTEPLLDSVHLSLLSWATRYYLHPPGEVFILGLSPRERRGEPPAPTGKQGVKLNERGLGLPLGALSRAKKQAALLTALQERPHSIDELNSQGLSRTIVRALAAKDLIEYCTLKNTEAWSSHDPLEPTQEQRTVINAINADQAGFICHLIEGITGSGKTEVYLQCAAEIINQGRQVLILLPEIGLTPQMLTRFQARFNAPVVMLHSGLSDGERDRHWAMARDGSAAIILGTRSAVFAPVANLGMIIVDEEHDQSFHQQDGLRYSARDVAVKRAQLHNCPIVLGSATPSLESLSNVEIGKYTLHALTERAGGASIPQKAVVDVRGLSLEAGLSQPLLSAMQATLTAGKQVLLFLNRRGFAPTLLCHDCGWFAGCDHCDARLAVHRKPAELRCHHCNSKKFLPRSCPSCQSGRLVSAGLGTEQSELTLERLFPTFPVLRVDSDSMTGRNAMDDFAQRLSTGEPCIILGTQMLTKGHHFPAVTLVGVVDADGLLFSPDFRGEERLLQLLTQVGGRAGRGKDAGGVIIQTHYPDHPLIQAVMERSYGELARNLLAERRQRALPPLGAMAMLRCDSVDFINGLNFLTDIKNQLQLEPGVQVIGPVPAAMARRAGRYRAQLLLLSEDRRALHNAASQLAWVADKTKKRSDIKWFMDVDPAEAV